MRMAACIRPMQGSIGDWARIPLFFSSVSYEPRPTVPPSTRAEPGITDMSVVVDGDLLRAIFEASQTRERMELDCGQPTPGCSAFGFMFDLQVASPVDPAAAIAVTGFQIFASDLDCNYDLYIAEGTWRKKDSRHAPESSHSCAAVAKWRRIPTLTVAHSSKAMGDPAGADRVHRDTAETSLHSLWVMLPQPIELRRGTTMSVYLHCPSALGAICYKDYETVRGQWPLHAVTDAVAPGAQTTANQHVRVLAGAFTQSHQPFRDVDGCACAYAGRIEYTYDLVETAGDGVRGRCHSEVEQRLFARPEGSSLHVREDAGTVSLDCTLTGKKYAVGASEIEAESRACQDCRWHDGVWVFDCGAHIMYTS